MNLKLMTCFEKTVGEGDNKRTYQLITNYASPLGETYDFCYEVLQEVSKQAQKAMEAAQSPKDKEDKPAA